MTRRTILALVAVVAVLSAAIGWMAGQQIKSPAEKAAETAPPTASLITVPVEQRALSSNVVVRGQAQFDDATDISVSGSTSGDTIITRVTKETGQQLDEGEVVVEVAGRPVIVLQGDLPSFRSLTPTLEGPDVRQLEEALVRLGLSPGTVDGVYDSATEGAVAELYRRTGYNPDEPTTDELAIVNSSRDAVDQAAELVRQAQSAINQSGVSESQRLELDRSVRVATEFRDDAAAESINGKTGAAAAVVGAQESFDAAAAANTLAAERLVEAEAGVHPDTGVAPTVEELTALGQVVTDAAAAEVEASNVLATAKADEAALILAVGRALVNAETDVAIAVASRSEILNQSGAAEANKALADAKKRLGEAQTELAKVQAEVGVEFPVNELIFLPSLPREIQRVNVEAGDTPQGPIMRVTGSGVVVRSAVSASDRPLIVEGAKALMENDDLGISIPATVMFVSNTAGAGDDVSSDRYAVRFEPDEIIPENGFDQNYRITIPIESTSGDVLVVPLAALSAGANGTARVEVETSPGETKLVEVATGLSSQGFVEITALGDGVVNVDDRVVVGRDIGLDGPDSDGSSEDDGDSG